MTTVSRRVFVAAACLFSSGASRAQDSSPRLESLLRKSLSAIASGAPNYADMEPMLADQVELQLSVIQKRLAALGNIRAIEFRGMQTTPSAGPAEYYRVRFDNGQMSWMINVSGSDKIQVLWTPG